MLANALPKEKPAKGAGRRQQPMTRLATKSSPGSENNMTVRRPQLLYRPRIQRKRCDTKQDVGHRSVFTDSGVELLQRQHRTACVRVSVTITRLYGADNGRAAWHTAMSDILKISRFAVVSECERCYRRDRHPMSAQRTREQKARQFRLHNPLAAHGTPHLCIDAIPCLIHKSVNRNMCAAQSSCSVMLVEQSTRLDNRRFAAKAAIYLSG
jgi:hypothetical protein